jgi:hypothetical protein
MLIERLVVYIWRTCCMIAWILLGDFVFRLGSAVGEVDDEMAEINYIQVKREHIIV